MPDAVVDPACLAAHDFTPGLGADFLPVFEVLWAVLAHGHPVPPEAEGLLQPLTRWWHDRGSAVSGP